MYLYRAFFLASLWTAPLFAAATEPDTSHQSKKLANLGIFNRRALLHRRQRNGS